MYEEKRRSYKKICTFNVDEIDYRIDYFSTVGGLLGLCIGISIVTIIELIWLALDVIRKVFAPVFVVRKKFFEWK
jgi:hypothetical protein